MFAAAEVGTVAFSGEQHAKPYAGVLLASWAAGSMVAGLMTGTLRLAIAPMFRVRRSAPRCLALVMVPIVVRRARWS